MLAQFPVVTFLPCSNAARARAFFESVLGLCLMSEDPFALVFDVHGIMLRVVKMKEVSPVPYTVLGWEVPDISAAVSALAGRNVTFEKYGWPGQDEQGIWDAPGGTRVAWFKDPDGNTLSVSEHH